MKKVVFLGFCLLGAHGANAESLDVFFQEQTPQEQPASPPLSREETPKKSASEPTVVKPQVLYLEDLEPAEKPKPKSKPKASAAPAQAKTKSVSAKTTTITASETKTAAEKSDKTRPVDLQSPLATAKPKPSPTSETGKIKTEPLPETFSKTAKSAPTPVPTPAQEPAVQKSLIEPRNTQAEQTPNTTPESTQTLSSFREHNAGQYAPFATQVSRQQAAHSLVTQAKNEGKSYPAGLDPFVIEFDQTFAVLSPNPAIRDLYKTAVLTPPTLKEQPLLSFKTIPTPTPVLSLPLADEVTKDPKTDAAKEQQAEIPQQQETEAPQPQTTVPEQRDSEATEDTTKQQDAELTYQQETITPQQPQTNIDQYPEETPSTNTLVLDDAPTQTLSLGDSDSLSAPLATVMVPETAQTLDSAYRNLLDQVAAAYHEGTLSVIHITGYVNTRPAHGEEVRGYTQIQSLGRRGAAIVVDYLKQKQVPESAMAYRIIPTSTIALQNPFYPSVSSESTLRLDIAGGKS